MLYYCILPLLITPTRPDATRESLDHCKEHNHLYASPSEVHCAANSSALLPLYLISVMIDVLDTRVVVVYPAQSRSKNMHFSFSHLRGCASGDFSAISFSKS